ncbi:HEAT repeat domain-containing protein [Amycolatopsis aidingensis]|uniref:HEAT repeat domain-containing protein n=1 Tax=Amycolatopsis aidingensis TaxID=2842453 RepID=UPI001C0C1C2C|nr:HEAT repeat domain-containing protein [Amycolatopsis aidingensis]
MVEPETPAERPLTHQEVLEFVAEHRRREAEDDPVVQERRRRYAEAAEGLLAELRGLIPDFEQTGFTLTDIGELDKLTFTRPDEETGEQKTRKVDYRAAVPVLLDWLPRVTYFPLAEDIVRVLSYGFAKKQARPVFLELFKNPPPVQDPKFADEPERCRELLRSSLGSGLARFAEPAVAEEYIQLALDSSLGRGRSAIVGSLPKTKDERVPEILVSLLGSSDVPVVRAATDALRKLRHTPARPHIEKLLDHEDELVRLDAKDALKRMKT